MIEYNHSTNLVLKGAQNWQTLYSSQSYGSFHSIFGRFHVTENDHGSLKINSCDLEIINYKGPIDIIIKEAQIFKLKEVTKNGDHIFHLKFKTKALLDEPIEDRYITNVQITNPSDLIIKKGDVLIISRELLSFTSDNIVTLKEKLDPIRRSDELNDTNNVQKTINRNSIKNGVFDSEYYFRNGKIIKVKTDGDFDDPYEKILHDLTKIKNGSISCHNSVCIFI